MQITPHLIEHLLTLSRLRLPVEAREKMRGDLVKILEYVGKLQEAGGAQGLSPREAIAASETRQDEVVACPSDERKSVMAQAPKKVEELFAVPKVFE